MPRRRNLPGPPNPGVARRDQHPQAALDSPERDGLLVPAQLGRNIARDVPSLQGALLVPDPDRVRVVLVLRLRDERDSVARVERRIRQSLGPVGDARDRYDANARVLPAHALARRRGPQVEARPRPLQAQPQPLPPHATWLPAASKARNRAPAAGERSTSPRMSANTTPSFRIGVASGACRIPRSVPSSTKPSLRGIASEAAFSGSTRISIRSIPQSSKPTRVSAATASVQNPWPALRCRIQ